MSRRDEHAADPFAGIDVPDERLADWVDGVMSERDRERFEAELRVSPRLRQQLEDYQRTVQDVRAALRAPTHEVEVADRVMAALASGAVGERPTGRVMPYVWAVACAAALLAIAIWVDGFGAHSAPVANGTDVARAEQPVPAAPEAAVGSPAASGGPETGDDETRGGVTGGRAGADREDAFLGHPDLALKGESLPAARPEANKEHKVAGDPPVAEPKPPQAVLPEEVAERDVHNLGGEPEARDRRLRQGGQPAAVDKQPVDGGKPPAITKGPPPPAGPASPAAGGPAAGGPAAGGPGTKASAPGRRVRVAPGGELAGPSKKSGARGRPRRGGRRDVRKELQDGKPQGSALPETAKGELLPVVVLEGRAEVGGESGKDAGADRAKTLDEVPFGSAAGPDRDRGKREQAALAARLRAFFAAQMRVPKRAAVGEADREAEGEADREAERETERSAAQSRPESLQPKTSEASRALLLGGVLLQPLPEPDVEPSPTAKRGYASHQQRDWLLVGPADRVGQVLRELRRYADDSKRVCRSQERRVPAVAEAQRRFARGQRRAQAPAEVAKDAAAPVRAVVLRFKVLPR